MCISNHKLKALAAIVLLLLLVMTLLPVSAFAAELPKTTATITVEKKLSGNTPPSADAFTFTLTPDAASYPMPAGENADTVSIQGDAIWQRNKRNSYKRCWRCCFAQ